MSPHPLTAIYDEYLESKMRSVLEGLVEALLLNEPTDINVFALDWLGAWQKRNGNGEMEELQQLRARRDALVSHREALLTRTREMQQECCASSSLSGVKQRERASQVSTVCDDGEGSAAGAARSHGGKEDDIAAENAAAEAKEQEMIRRVKDQDRRAAVSASAISKERIASWKQPYHEKSPEARELLRRFICENEKLEVLFGHLSEQQLFSVIDAMFLREAMPGDDVIVQGEEGDNFYIVAQGTFDVFVRRGDGPPGKVMEYGPGGMFGELALMYNAERAATVRATSKARLWALDRDSFQMMLTTAESTRSKQYESFLEEVEILQDLTRYERAHLSDMLESRVFEQDEVIITQGEIGNYFYILEDGESKAYIGGESGEIEVMHYTKPGEYFGEIALLRSATRSATVRAKGKGCRVLSVGRDDFDLVLGPIKEILSKHIDKYPQYADFVREEESRAKSEQIEREKIHRMKETSRRAGVSASKVSQEMFKTWHPPYFEKPQKVKDRIKEIIAKNDKLQVLFGDLTETAVYGVIDAMSEQPIPRQQHVIQQGEAGDNFYIVAEGTFDVLVQRGDGVPGKVCEYGPGDMFGELALMYNAPRAATVVATSAAKVWALDRECFQLMLATAEATQKAQYEEFLINIDMFRHMTKYEIAQLSDMLTSEPFDEGEVIVEQGAEGNYFYIVEDGDAKAYINGERGEVEVKHYHTPGDYFGEVALITNAARRATVRACAQGCSVLSVSREDFDRVLGPIRTILEENIDKYPAYATYLQR
eukprot:TRINITY_DN34830_c0_g1_i1.p1 TRINITY_DN34830_c0_g1~~TRINITY_DN34830_c0_g1_i1.p1  ORF type:complete len:768 (-),score=171.47 TRINITY_DN34830_c0_g1_i1:132-2435(-)